MYPDKLTPSERRSVIGLLFMIAIGGLIIFFIKIANDSEWGDNQWAGVSAIANWVEALAVVGALIYAGMQIRAVKASDVQRRRADLVDRLDRAVHEELEPNVIHLLLGASGVHSAVIMRRSQSDVNIQTHAKAMFEKHRSEVATALEALASAFQATQVAEVPIEDQKLKDSLMELALACAKVYPAVHPAMDVEYFNLALVDDDVRTLIWERLEVVLQLTRSHMRSTSHRAGG